MPPLPSPHAQKKITNEDFAFFISPTFLFAAIANKQTHITSSQLRKEFGIGIVEWRCMSMMTLEMQASAARICQVGGMNKSLVSKALSKLHQLHYIETCSSSKSQKPVLLQLTPAGKSLFNGTITVALKIETESLQGLNKKEQAELIRMLKVVYKNVEPS